MIINEKLKKELLILNNEISYILKSNTVTDYRLENFLKAFEKARYNILYEINVYNKNVEFEQEKISTIDTDYNAEVSSNILKIYVPETLPSYKNIKTHAQKRILLNISEITKPFSNLFNDQVCVFIKIYDKINNWDVDNRNIKPICDGLIASKVIQDDNIDKMFYCVKGEYSNNPHTEIYVFDYKKLSDLSFFYSSQM